MEHGSTSSPPTPEAFPEPSASSYPPGPEHLENIDQPSTPPPTPSQASTSFLALVVPWSDMGLFLYDIGQRIEKVSLDGHCLMYSIMQALKLDHDIHIDHRIIANRVWKEINERIIFYVHFICGERNKLDDVLKDVCKYIEDRNYTIPIADLIVGVAVNALNSNLKIYENDKGVKKEIDFEPDNAQSLVTVHLLYLHDSNLDGDPNNLTSHYDALVLRNDAPISQCSNQNDAATSNQLELNMPMILLHDMTSDEDMYMDLTKILKDLSKSIEVSNEILKYNIEPREHNLLDMSVYTRMAAKRVVFQPYAIDGNVIYEIVCKKHEWHKKHEDGHYWVSTSGKNKDLKGTRKCLKCIGALQCQNKRCVMYRCHALSNIKSFQKIGEDYFCRSCHQFMSRPWCDARKIMEYNRETETLTIWHQRKHRCQVKPGHKTVEQKQKGKEMLVYIMRQYPKASHKEQTRLGALYHLERHEPQMARQFIITMMNNGTYNQAKKEIMDEIIGVERHSINVVGIIKQKQDEEDPLHIFKINDKKWNGKPSFVFKSSTPMARITLLMDQNNKVKTPFQDTVAFMDGLHSRVVDYTTLTLWVHNPVILHLQRIACMECESENTENITTFLTLVNEMLRQVKGDANFTWAPRCIMADENGANKNAIGNVFGEELQKKMISCKWHYLRCIHKQSHRITDKATKERFLELTKSMVKDAVTKTLYIQYYKELYNICQKFKTTKWLDFWHERRAHYVPSFRGYGYPGLDLAEAGQSSMCTKRMNLMDAAFDDNLKQMHQDELYAATLHNEVDGVGHQRKTVMQIMVENEAEQKK